MCCFDLLLPSALLSIPFIPLYVCSFSFSHVPLTLLISHSPRIFCFILTFAHPTQVLRTMHYENLQREVVGQAVRTVNCRASDGGAIGNANVSIMVDIVPAPPLQNWTNRCVTCTFTLSICAVCFMSDDIVVDFD